MTEHDEHDMEQRFHALRREDAAAAPAFRATLTAVLAGTHQRRPAGAAVATALALIVLVLLLTLRGRHRDTVDLAGVRLHTPTDFLLRVPGEDLLRTVPTFTFEWRLLQ
jgi:hypothetical protein